MMVRITWKIASVPQTVCNFSKWQLIKLKITYQTFFYNHFMDHGYLADVCMEPMFWFVDNFTKFLGPFFVFSVCALTASVIGIAYWIGLPYWWDRNPAATVLLLLVGHWLLANICFHYYMAASVPPGYPPQGALIPEAASICKKCIAPKPPRTHHCSVCNRCILKMDHHCPWLNNCIGHYNHRYFFLYMVYMVLGVFFLIVFGVELAYYEVYVEPSDAGEDEDDYLEGHPVRFNNSVIIPVPEYLTGNLSSPETSPTQKRTVRQSCITYMAFINVGVFVALGSLVMWHARKISAGETSIEAHINKAETKKYAAQNKAYINPYNFGRQKNWRLFLGLVGGRTWRHVLLPSAHKPVGNGLTWPSVQSDSEADTDQEGGD